MYENEVLAGLTSDTNNVLGILQLAALKVPGLVRVEDRAKAHDLVRLNIVKVVEMVVARSRPFRGRVLGALSKRITDLFLMIGAVAFRQADVRLTAWLIELSGGSAPVELRTVREVIPRQRQGVQSRGWSGQGRRATHFLNLQQLEDQAGQVD